MLWGIDHFCKNIETTFGRGKLSYFNSKIIYMKESRLNLKIVIQ